MLQNPAGTSPQGNISLADGYKQEWCSISWSSSTRWSHLISNVCMCVHVRASLVPLQRHKQPARQCQTVSLYPHSTPASCLQTGWKLITLPPDTSAQPHTSTQHRSPGYGTLPLVTSSVSKIPKDQTSDLMVKRPYKAASGAVHLMGNLAPVRRKKQWWYATTRERKTASQHASNASQQLSWPRMTWQRSHFLFGNQVQTRLKMDSGEISKVRIKGISWE